VNYQRCQRGLEKCFLEHVFPSFFNGDKDEVLKRAKITEQGKLTQRFSLQDFVDGSNFYSNTFKKTVVN
jgi:hypothetical protein